MTMHDVARQAGVSQATVSLALSAEPGVRAPGCEKPLQAAACRGSERRWGQRPMPIGPMPWE